MASGSGGAGGAGKLLTRALRGLERLLLKRESVGTDFHGNTYYKGTRVNSSGVSEETRWVALKGLQAFEYTPDAIPPEWFRWLNKGRPEPPTPEELEGYQQGRATLAAKVAQLEAEEAKRRLRMETIGAERPAADAEPNMGRFLEQLTGKGYGHESSADSPGRADEAPPGTSEPEGSGDTFKPGAWVPGQQQS